MRSPSSTPAGIFTASVLCFFTRPAPRQVPQGSEIILPLPWHVGQVCWIEKKPWDMRTVPEPWQVSQVLGCVPGLAPVPWQVSHDSIVGMRMRVSVPRAACSRVISRL
jgi:hypothetical protein